MDYEKAYNKALERANEYHFSGAKQCIIDTLEYIFPELKESEDEKIRKELIKYLKEGVEGYIPAGDRSDYQRWLTWLEKQKVIQTPQWMIDFLDENRIKFASLMEDYDEQREAEGKLLAIIDWLESLKKRMEKQQ